MTIIKMEAAAGHWTAVPRAAAEDQRLTLEARGLLLWFLVKPPTWKVRAEVARSSLKLTEFMWGKLTRELKESGYYLVEESRDRWGRIEKEIIVTPTPKKFEAGDQPLICPVLVDLGPTNKKERNSLNKNNNNADVVVASDVFENNLLSKTEHQQVLQLLKNCSNAQTVMDELVGAIRLRGRDRKGVRVPASFVRRLMLANSNEFYCGAAELELRQARALAITRETVFINQPSHVSIQRPKNVAPPAVKTYLDKLKKEVTA